MKPSRKLIYAGTALSLLGICLAEAIVLSAPPSIGLLNPVRHALGWSLADSSTPLEVLRYRLDGWTKSRLLDGTVTFRCGRLHTSSSDIIKDWAKGVCPSPIATTTYRAVHFPDELRILELEEDSGPSWRIMELEVAVERELNSGPYGQSIEAVHRLLTSHGLVLISNVPLGSSNYWTGARRINYFGFDPASPAGELGYLSLERMLAPNPTATFVQVQYLKSNDRFFAQVALSHSPRGSTRSRAAAVTREDLLRAPGQSPFRSDLIPRMTRDEREAQ